MKKFLIGLGAVVVVSVVAYLLFLAKTPKSYVIFSINSEIELALSSSNTVIDVTAINDDADVFISDLDLEGMSLDEAVDTIISDAIDTGYIDEYSDDNSIVLTAINDDEETRISLENTVLNAVNNKLEDKNVSSVVVVSGLTDEMKTTADSYDISYGKMLLIERAVALDETLNADDLATMSIKDIQSKIKESLEAARAQNQQTNEEKIQEKEQLKTEAQEQVKTYEDKLLTDNGYDPDNMTDEEKESALTTITETKKNEIKAKVAEIQTQVDEEVKNQTASDIKTIIKEIRNQVNSKK